MSKIGIAVGVIGAAAAATVVGLAPAASAASAGTAGAASVGTVAASTPGPSQVYFCAGAPYSVEYKVTDFWPGGYIGDVVIRNSGDVVPRWLLSWQLAPGQHVNGMWNAGYAHVGTGVEVNGIFQTTSIPAAGATEFGFNASGPGSVLPTEVTFNGATCR